MTHPDELFMRRCFEVAQRGAGHVSPNPMVGAVLVHEGRIIGEGWHERYGEAHAEVNAIRSVSVENQRLIALSTLYCSLEPCFHHGKTPPCVELVLTQKIPRVVVSNLDPNPLVAGQSIARLRAAGVEVVTGLCEAEGQWLNRFFLTHITQKRPYVLLKWAESADGFLGKTGERTPISGPLIQRLVHRWRAECDAVLVGTTTALVDNPRLDARFFSSKKTTRVPRRVVLDFQKKIPATAHLLDDSQPTWVIGPSRSGKWQQTDFQDIVLDGWIPELLRRLYAARCGSLLVEGGAEVHRQWLATNTWDEIRRIKNPRTLGAVGVAAPMMPANARLHERTQVGDDVVETWLPIGNNF
jgi:diaminohydroxyphosphoribosylaminopyrimidine deaminase / 5-amino-6-(5-phosphoribosylamino)uracil reductase